jgi:hypothetical protein
MKDKTYPITIDPTPLKEKPEWSIRSHINKRLNKNTDVTIDQLSNLVAPPNSFTWSPGIFNGTPSNDNWTCQSIFALDFDGGELSIEEVYDRLHLYEIKPQLWYETFSSSETLIKFRVVLFLDYPVTNPKIHKLISLGLLKLFPEADQSCKDQARYYFGGSAATVTSYSPISLSNLIFISSTTLCAGDSMRNRSLPIMEINSTIVETAPKWELLYYNYKNYHSGAQLNNSNNFPPPYNYKRGKLQKVDFDKSSQNIRIFREFLNGKWLSHMELFGLARNLQYVNGGFKLMNKIMTKFNSKRVTNYNPNNFAILTYLKKVQYPPQPIGEFSPYSEDSDLHDFISESIDKRGKIKVIESSNPIPLVDAEEKFKKEFDRVINEDRVDGIYLFRIPTAIGKTEIITSVHATIAAPTNDLKNEIGGRMKVNYLTTPDPIIFENSSITNQMNYYYSIGLPSKSIEVLHSIVNTKNKDQYSKKDIENANSYINTIRDCYTTTSTLLTTHQRAIHSSFSNDTIVFDEDPLKSLIDIKSFKISDLFSVNVTLKSKELEFVIKSLMDTPIMEIRSTPIFNLDLDKLIKDVSKLPNTNLKSNIFDFFSSSFYVRDTHKPDIVHYVVKRDIPRLKKIIILSATAPINLYKRLFGDRLEVIDISEVQQTGKIIQHTTKSYSRNSLNTNTKDIVNTVGDTPVITFKSYQNHFSNPSNMWFGNCSGYDELKGKDIAVVGTPHINNVVYFLTAKVLGIDFKTSDLSMSYQKVIYNGFEFKFNCFNNENLRIIQFSYIESDLIQAVGRARTLRTGAKVDLYSNFPLRISSEFKF